MSEQSISVLAQVHEYKEVARGLWNNHYKAKFEPHRWAYVDSYQLIKSELFKSLVLYPTVGEPADGFVLGLPSQFIRVVLTSDWPTSVKINRDKGATHGYWDHAVTKLSGHAVLRFINLFDWNTYGVLDMAMVMAEIASYPENPELEGHRLLVELMYVDVVVDRDALQIVI